MRKLREAQRFFGPRAEAYRASPSHADPQDLARMLAWLEPRPGARALDLATGGGHTARALREAGCAVAALDATPSMARIAAEHAEPFVGDALALPFRSHSFDLAASRLAPHHFEDLGLAVREAARVLRKGGALYVFDLTTPEDARAQELIDRVETLRDPSHVHSWPPSAWRAALAGAFLQVERLEERASEFDLEPWLARTGAAPQALEEARALLAEHAGALGGYGIAAPGRMRVLRIEVLARKRA